MATVKKKVHEWLTESYPGIRQEAHDALIYFADEASARSDYHSGTTWGKTGKTPVVEATGVRFGVNMISAVSGEGTMRYMVIKDRFNADVFIKFLKQLVNSHDRPVVVVVDGHSAHKAKKVQKYIQQEPRLLGVYILPAYSPELNPDEYVWGYLKSGCLGKMIIRTKKQFQKAVSRGLRSLQKLPDIIMGFFRRESTAYACVEQFG